MINYMQKFAGGKVSIEVSDPADIYKLSTLYADGSEARVVDVDAGVYRLINGIWTYVPGSGGFEEQPLSVMFSSEQEYEESAEGSVDQSPETLKAAIKSGRPLLCYYKTSKGTIKSLPQITTAKSENLTHPIYMLEAQLYEVRDPRYPTESYEHRKCIWRWEEGSEPEVTVEFIGT